MDGGLGVGGVLLLDSQNWVELLNTLSGVQYVFSVENTQYIT